MISVRVKKVDARATVPVYMSEGAAGCDVTACLEETMRIEPMSRVAIPTGLVFEIPSGYEVQVRPRSGLSFKHGLTVVNAPGTIDSDYRGEVKILLINLGKETVEVNPGDRIAQLVIQAVPQARWELVNAVGETTRQEGGFGSTGR